MIEMLSREFSKKVFDELTPGILEKFKKVVGKSEEKQDPLDLMMDAIQEISYLVDNERKPDGNWHEFIHDTELTDEEMLVIEALMIKHGWTSGMARI